MDDLVAALEQFSAGAFMLLGGGSNLLLDSARISVPVLWINHKGIEICDEHEDHVVVRAMAGENWHEFVSWCVAHDYGGLENLSLIPGTVGAAPLQNIGAYGVELKDTVVSVEVMNVHTRELRQFSRDECRFGYRDSVFKKQQRGQWIIHAVSFRLSTREHQLRLDYGAIQEKLAAAGNVHPGIKDVSEAVIAIRRQRLPDPLQLPNAGSFFKNPLITAHEYEEIVKGYPQVPAYRQADGQVKVPAGWLIEQCGWKGKRHGNVGVHEHHALVLVNYGGATGKQIVELANEIQQDVELRFGLSLAFEVNLGSDTVFPEN